LKFVPHDYQKFAIQYIIDHPIAAVLLDMGLGKTAITLTAIEELIHDRFEVRSALVVAPLRVARDTWPSEIEKWDHLKDLTFTVAVGNEKQRLTALKKSADIHIINRENIPWLIEKSGIPFDYDMIVIDELSSFKNHQAKRFRALMKVRPTGQHGLSGSPVPLPPMGSWTCGPSTGFWILESGSEDIFPDIAFNISDQTSTTALSFTLTSRYPELKNRSTTRSPISRFP
jgi:hypothetical protein